MAVHPGHTLLSQFSQKFLALISINEGEQLAMGIPQEQITPIFITSDSQSHNVPRGVKRRALDQLPSPRNIKLARST
jgi:hypothetical protein